ncbi:ring hydroxylating beta subunit [Paraburkholderia fungorum]|jgi:salicylate 5-hydroxylase small subunit|uniref:Ring hydroxylating beta subunit n=1 Tax=Paraburkholderia fungorum TaxID=134537 RepID=A0AAU8TF77_9BURK|nr:aromatic-ring-hydroxylating dioxygenase subunit beta [Paraburkholderia fungorum]AJZ60368.1 ring hydroxylating beta subunit [Paraburkholderia fungorum]MBU7436285.1 aromatic-ring-hydroxylating dioxygenase subunit beta [Paraburkholderia fungorum]PZR39355.1 MAG: salicylate hydroxylase [Paraburkholderia fungorum]
MVDFDTYYGIVSLYARYAAVLDANDWGKWPDFFTDDCTYKLQPRENFDGGFPLATLAFESKGMLMDRVFAIRETLFHDPYYQRHVIGAPVIKEVEEGAVVCEANYVVMRTKRDQLTEVFNVGRYVDRIVTVNDRPVFASKLCVFDSEMIPNSIIYPV